MYAEVNINVVINATDDLDMTFGFDFSVRPMPNVKQWEATEQMQMPANSSMFLDLADPDNSSAYGL